MFEIPIAIRFWIDLIGLIGGAVGVLAGAAWWLIRHSLVTHTALEGKMAPLGTVLDDHGNRIAKVENDMKHLPSGDDWHSVREQMIRLEGGINNLETQVTAVRETMERIERPLNVLIDGKLKAGSK